MRRMLLAEGAIVSAMGAVTGIGLGIAFGWTLTKSMEGLSIPTSVFRLLYDRITAFAVLAVLVGLLASAGPARSAARTSIVESLGER